MKDKQHRTTTGLASGFKALPVILWTVLAVLGFQVALADEELDFGLATNNLERIDLIGNTTFSDNDLKSVLRIREHTWTRPLNVPK